MGKPFTDPFPNLPKGGNLARRAEKAGPVKPPKAPNVKAPPKKIVKKGRRG